MRNNFFIIFLSLFLSIKSSAEDLFIEAKNITLDKNNKVTIFKNDVTLETADKKITSDFAEYNKVTGKVILKNNVVAKDKLNNIVETNYAEFDNISNFFKTIGFTKFITSKNYTLKGADINFDNKNKKIKSNQASILEDLSGNKIYLENFEYIQEKNIFKSVGLVKILDQFENTYNFSQIYIDTEKKEMLGTDIKAFLNNDDFKVNKKNDPRIFANSMKFNEEISEFSKSIFTMCEYKEGEKCPPWTLQASKMMHDNKKKTIFYDNAVIKVYNIPIFYLPFLSHPDPSVKRRSGLLPPTFTDSKNLGAGLSIPYFWAINDDKNFTVTSRLFNDEHPLILGEYHQAFKDASFLTDFGYTKGYKKTSSSKKSGDKSHFFSKFTKNFQGKTGSENTLNLKIQNVSNDKYLKLYKIQSNLVDYNEDLLENSISFSHSEDDLFFGLNASVFETLKNDYNDKYEYILPELTLGKNLLSSDKFGNLDLQTNLKVHNYDTNKVTNFLVNDFDWESNNFILNSKIKNTIIGKFRNINYEAKNIDIYKKDTTSELFGAIGLLSKMDLEKKENNNTHLLSPKLLLRLSPGSMRKETNGSTLNPVSAFSIDRVGNINNFETGNSATVGFDYSIKKDNINKFNFSVAQIINEKENKKQSSKTSLDEKLSDLVGDSSFSINDKFKLNYRFNIDQNYQSLNYSDLGSNINFGNFDIDFNYIEESKHIGNQEYFKTKLQYLKNKNSVSFETKRNLITNSSEFYDLSYEYINDCLRAGLVFRREFYNDSELEADNSLMFNITLIPFGNLNSPKVNK
tara:strand:+ start:4090 stop:6486 length:2397 start_codon:yes stop_codon:yes gene_type:complete